MSRILVGQFDDSGGNCDADEIDEFVADPDDTAGATLTTAQKLAVAKKLLRREVLKRKLEQ